jgi:DNA-binding MarR family transcriptional regulator
VSAFGRASHAVLALFAAADSPLTQEAIRDKTGLARRTVKYSLKKLKTLGLIAERPAFCDMRRKVYLMRGGGGIV